MSKKFLTLIIFVFMFSIFHMAKFAESHPNLPAGTTRAIKYDGIKTRVDNRAFQLATRQTRILDTKGVIGALNTSWDANEAAIKAGREAAISNALSTFIGAIAAIPTGGTSTIAALAAYGPTFLNAYNAYTSSQETGGTTLNRASYIKGFETALAGYDAAVAWQKSEHEDYTDIYVNEYLKMEVDHDGGLYTQGASAIDGPLTKEELYSYIHKISITYDAEGKMVIGEFVDGISKKEDGYYHLIQDHYGNNRLGSTDHTMTTHLHLAEVRIIPLEYSKKCKGRNCTDMHRTSYEAFSTHFVSCKDYHTDSFTDACRDTWYTCDSNHTNKKKDHQVSTCIKFIQVSPNQSRVCGATFKTCLRVVIDHNLTDSNARGTQHSATSVYEGENRMHACNIHESSVSGDHSSTWLCNQSPCSNRQVPYCLAMCPYTGTHGTATTPMHVCNIHPTSAPGDHSSTWLCNESPCSNRQVPHCLAMCPYTGTHGTTTTPTPVFPTVPDRPGSFSLTSGYISIQLSWTSPASDGGSAITAYEYQYQSSTNGRLSWSSWSDWTSGGTDNFTLIQGLSRGTDYSVRMRAVNSVGTSTVTGQHIVRTRND